MKKKKLTITSSIDIKEKGTRKLSVNFWFAHIFLVLKYGRITQRWASCPCFKLEKYAKDEQWKI